MSQSPVLEIRSAFEAGVDSPLVGHIGPSVRHCGMVALAITEPLGANLRM
jgi:hypothetical protein